MNPIEKYNESNKFGQENNLQLLVVSKGHIEYTMQLEKKHFALPNLVHGGVIAGLMDALLSVSAFSSVADENKNVATVEFKINYLKPVRQVEILKGIGKVVKYGKRIIVCQGEIFDQSGDLIATGTGTIIPL